MIWGTRRESEGVRERVEGGVREWRGCNCRLQVAGLLVPGAWGSEEGSLESPLSQVAGLLVAGAWRGLRAREAQNEPNNGFQGAT